MWDACLWDLGRADHAAKLLQIPTMGLQAFSGSTALLPRQHWVKYSEEIAGGPVSWGREEWFVSLPIAQNTSWWVVFIATGQHWDCCWLLQEKDDVYWSPRLFIPLSNSISFTYYYFTSDFYIYGTHKEVWIHDQFISSLGTSYLLWNI